MQDGQDHQDQTLRCFVGAFLDAASVERLAGMLVPRVGLRRVEPESWHVTLKFLGSIPEAAVPQVLAAVEALAGHPAEVTVTGFIGLPRAAYARVIAAEIADDERLARWAGQLAARFGPEDRPFRPHVTVARSRRPLRYHRLELPAPLVIRLGAPALYRSHLDGAGARYERVARTRGGEPGLPASID